LGTMGAGNLGETLTRRFAAAVHKVCISQSKQKAQTAVVGDASRPWNPQPSSVIDTNISKNNNQRKGQG